MNLHLLRGLAFALVLLAQAGGRLEAQDPQQPDWKKQKEEADAQREALEAQKKLLDAQRALVEAQSADQARLNRQLQAARAAKEVADAEKAAADARKAESEASLAAAKAAIGSVTGSGIEGDVTVGTDAGVTEAALLAARSAVRAADRIAAALPVSTTSPPNNILLLFSASDVPQFHALAVFDTQVLLIRKAFDAADAKSQQADPERLLLRSGPILGTAGLALEAISGIMSYFRSDYAVGGVKLDYDDSLLLHALAGNGMLLIKYTVQLPAQYNAAALNNPGQRIVTSLTTISQLREEGPRAKRRHERAVEHFNKTATEATGEAAAAAKKYAALHQEAVDLYTAAIALCEAFLMRLTTYDEKGNAPLSTIVREGAIAEALKDGARMLVVKLQTSGGAYYSKKNLWTLFGEMPFYHMGGVVASYVLMEGPAGSVVGSGVVPVHGGFIKSGKVQATVETP